MPLRDRELVNPPPSLASLQELSGPALIAMLIAGGVAVLDGIAAPTVVLIGLLAIPPVIAAMSASLPETAVVGALCLVLAVLSILWEGASSPGSVWSRSLSPSQGPWQGSGSPPCGRSWTASRPRPSSLPRRAR